MDQTYVYSRDRKTKGVLTGSFRPCQLEGCRGEQSMVRWPDGTWTWPCSKGMRLRKDGDWELV